MLDFDIDEGEVQSIVDEFEASQSQVGKAFNRALRRTAATLRRLSSKGLKSELDLRNAKALRRRIREIKLKDTKHGVRLWFGTNDMPVSAFKGSPKKTNSGASFRGQEFKSGFIRKSKSGPRTIFQRVGKKNYPISESKLDVRDKMQIFLEDEVFVEIEDVFFKHFRQEIKARTIYGVGQ